MYYLNNPTEPLQWKGTEFYGTTHYDKAARKELQASQSNWNNTQSPVWNQDDGSTHYDRKQKELSTQMQDMNFWGSPTKERVHRVPTQANWKSPDHNEIKGHNDHNRNSFQQRGAQLKSDAGVFPQTDYSEHVSLFILGPSYEDSVGWWECSG